MEHVDQKVNTFYAQLATSSTRFEEVDQFTGISVYVKNNSSLHRVFSFPESFAVANCECIDAFARHTVCVLER